MTKSLHDQIEFYSPFRVLPGGSIERAHGFYAPDLLDEEVEGSWELLNGYSGQDSYPGPIMHDSEYIGGQLEKDILATPGVYVLIAATWSPEGDDPDAEYEYEGWAVAKYTGMDEGPLQNEGQA